ncbi:MAG: CDP-diacylglycerol--glycerol-3-phosphate 3-phosphatidyltransferase [Casimicrobiaceae bacterium]
MSRLWAAGEGPFALRNLPNTISIGRIFLVPVLVVLLRSPSRTAAALAAGTFFLASWSDFFDGYLARRHGLTSTLGKLLDPLADKLIVTAALIMLTAMPRQPRIASWVVVLIIGRELAVTGLRTLALSEGIVLAAEELGKYKTILQMLALQGLLLHYTWFGVDFFSAGMYFLWPSLVLSLWSGIDYHVRIIRRVMAPGTTHTA